MALAVQVYLRMDRPDLAEKALGALTAADDESALTQLSAALVYLALVSAWGGVCGGEEQPCGQYRMLSGVLFPHRVGV